MSWNLRPLWLLVLMSSIAFSHQADSSPLKVPFPPKWNRLRAPQSLPTHLSYSRAIPPGRLDADLYRLIPGVSQLLAERIDTYIKTYPIEHKTCDLQNIKGVGPKLASKISRFLPDSLGCN